MELYSANTSAKDLGIDSFGSLLWKASNCANADAQKDMFSVSIQESGVSSTSWLFPEEFLVRA